MIDGRPDFRRGRRLLWLGAGLTLIYLGSIGFYCYLNRTALGGLVPNELGDFLAGVFSPLALAWLVIGYFQQGEELRHSANALWLQSEELRRSVDEQRALVNITKEQLDWEKEKIKIEQNINSSLAVPVISAFPNGGSTGSGAWRRDVKVSNFGPDCTMLVLKILKDDVEIEKKEISMLGKGKYTTISIQSEIGFKIEGSYLHISCLDVSKRPHLVSFKFVNCSTSDPFTYDLIIV